MNFQTLDLQGQNPDILIHNFFFISLINADHLEEQQIAYQNTIGKNDEETMKTLGKSIFP